LYASPNIISVVKLKKVRWTGHVTSMGEIHAYNISVGKHDTKRELGKPRNGWGRIILELILGK